jgi:Flavin-binding monooxygenase-like
MHSKYYRSPTPYKNKKILIIGNSASGHDLSTELIKHAKLPVYQSIRSKSRWDGNKPPPGISWLPIVSQYLPNGQILFTDGTCLDNIDTVIYCTGYKHSFPFWNEKANGRPIWDYTENKLIKGYWHTFLHDFPTIGLVGIPRVLTFRSWEYQAITLARIFAGRNARPLPSVEEQERWERERLEVVKREKRKFHDIQWETGETLAWLGGLFAWAGLGTLEGDGRIPPPLTREVVWAIEHLRKYPEPGKETGMDVILGDGERDWVLIDEVKKDLLHFI